MQSRLRAGYLINERALKVNFVINWGPQSKKKVSERLWSFHTFFWYRLAALRAVQVVVVGMKFASFPTLSTATRIAL